MVIVFVIVIEASTVEHDDDYDYEYDNCSAAAPIQHRIVRALVLVLETYCRVKYEYDDARSTNP
jgi:hypothetical protein